MPKQENTLKITKLRTPDIRVTVKIDLNPEMYARLLERAKQQEEELKLINKTEIMSPEKALEAARFWVNSGHAPKNAVMKLRQSAFYGPPEKVRLEVLQAFLDAHPLVKVAERGRGRPKGYSPEANLRAALGLVVTDLLTSLPDIPRKFKVA